MSKRLRLHTGKLREINIYELSKLGAFDRRMTFPFAGLVTRPDAIEFRTSSYPPDWPSQEIAVCWVPIPRANKRPVFVCPHCSRKAEKLYDTGGLLTCRVCCNLRYRTQQIRRRSQLRIKASKIRARLLAADTKLGDAWPPRPFAMTRRVYERHIRRLIEIEGAINTLERVASPRYRRERERNRDGSFVTRYDSRLALLSA